MGARQKTKIAVIGAGVVGCAVTRQLTLAGADVALYEKGDDILSGASKANSAILHTGFDAPANSLELQLIRRGYALYQSIHETLNLPLTKSGAFVTAWTQEELEKLPAIQRQATENGVDDTQILSPEGLRKKLPELSASALGALHVPGESIIDPWSAPLAYLKHAAANGAALIRNCEVLGGDFKNGEWRIDTSIGAFRTDYIVNCAGLYGDIVEERLFGDSGFRIKPRKGQFVVFDKAASSLVERIILQTPAERTKGVVVCPTIYGNVLVGPTAEEQDSRTDAGVDESTLRRLVSEAERIVPALKDMPVTATYAGIRPATEKKDYQFRNDAKHNYLCLGGIRSTGLTAALGIAEYAQNMLADSGFVVDALYAPAPAGTPNLAECRQRDWTVPGYREIVCHCELVTDREIENALAGPLGARNMGGLKRRTRATMGRCQGFYCSARLAEMCVGHFKMQPHFDPVRKASSPAKPRHD